METNTTTVVKLNHLHSLRAALVPQIDFKHHCLQKQTHHADVVLTDLIHELILKVFKSWTDTSQKILPFNHRHIDYGRWAMLERTLFIDVKREKCLKLLWGFYVCDDYLIYYEIYPKLNMDFMEKWQLEGNYWKKMWNSTAWSAIEA